MDTNKNVSELIVTNITASASIDMTLDLRQLARNMIDVEYDRRRFSAIIHRMRTPKATCMISGNGHIISVGTKTIGDAMISLRRTKNSIASARGIDRKCLRLSNFSIHNIASTYSWGSKLNLKSLNQVYQTQSIYDPSVFGGLRFNGLGALKKIKAIIFSSGSIILTGARDVESLNSAFSQLNAKIYTAVRPPLCAPPSSAVTLPHKDEN
jgi:transcription initiation factor TFIID TATA-box-binding protein